MMGNRHWSESRPHGFWRSSSTGKLTLEISTPSPETEEMDDERTNELYEAKQHKNAAQQRAKK